MATQEDFLQSIFENLQDDEPRLVYADWLDENGEPNRAEFIRTQCELFRLQQTPHSASSAESAEKLARVKYLDERQRKLQNTHGWDWAEELGVNSWYFERGFVSRVEVNFEHPNVKDHILKLMKQCPALHFRDVNQFCEFEPMLEALPYLGSIQGLELWYLYAFEDSMLAEMLQSEQLANLRTLVLHHDRNGNLADEQVIIDGLFSPHRSKIETLVVNVDCSWRGPSNPIINAISESPYLRNLRYLDLSNAGDVGNTPGLVPDVIERLANSPNLANLEVLDLRSVHATAECWNQILEMPQLSRLNKLFLGGACEIPNNQDWIPVVGQFANLENWQSRFDQVANHIDWETDFIGPYHEPVEGSHCWAGQNWGGLSKKTFEEMHSFVMSRDFDGLEKHFREVAIERESLETANQVDQVPLGPWLVPFQNQLQRVLDRAVSEGYTTIFLRFREDLDWSGDFGLYKDFEPEYEVDKPFYEGGYTPGEIEMDSPAFGQARTLCQSATPSTRPSMLKHYMLARVFAAIGRAVFDHPCNATFFAGCMTGCLRIKE